MPSKYNEHTVLVSAALLGVVHCNPHALIFAVLHELARLLFRRVDAGGAGLTGALGVLHVLCVVRAVAGRWGDARGGSGPCIVELARDVESHTGDR